MFEATTPMNTCSISHVKLKEYDATSRMLMEVGGKPVVQWSY